MGGIHIGVLVVAWIGILVLWVLTLKQKRVARYYDKATEYFNSKTADILARRETPSPKTAALKQEMLALSAKCGKDQYNNERMSNGTLCLKCAETIARSAEDYPTGAPWCLYVAETMEEILMLLGAGDDIPVVG